MRKLIRKCLICNIYTLKENHCGKKTVSAHPIDFKPFFKYINQRIKVIYPWIQLHGEKDSKKES